MAGRFRWVEQYDEVYKPKTNRAEGKIRNVGVLVKASWKHWPFKSHSWSSSALLGSINNSCFSPRDLTSSPNEWPMAAVT